MLRLLETQRQFAEFVFGGSPAHMLTENVHSNGLSAEQRLGIYRNNTRMGLTEALSQSYPVVKKLVGDEFFNYLAWSYVVQHPPKAGCLLNFGNYFANFIAAFEPAKTLVYLPDVAKLEWYWQEAYYEADHAGLNLTALADMSPEVFGSVRFICHPSVRLMASRFPVLRIWQANQDEVASDDAINLKEGGCHLLLVRPEWEVLLIALSAAEYHFLTLLQSGLSLLEAVETMSESYHEFNCPEQLNRWVGAGLIVDFTLADTRI